jgi:hypothetical protein
MSSATQRQSLRSFLPFLSFLLGRWTIFVYPLGQLHLQSGRRVWGPFPPTSSTCSQSRRPCIQQPSFGGPERQSASRRFRTLCLQPTLTKLTQLALTSSIRTVLGTRLSGHKQENRSSFLLTKRNLTRTFAKNHLVHHRPAHGPPAFSSGRPNEGRRLAYGRQGFGLCFAAAARWPLLRTR